MKAHAARVKGNLQTAASKVTRWLDARGYRTYERGLDVPVVTADVPGTALDALGHLDGVATVEVTGTTMLHGVHWFAGVYGDSAQTIVSSAADQAFCNGEGYQPSTYANLIVPASHIFNASAFTESHTKWTTELIAANADAPNTRMAPNASPYITGWVGTPQSSYAAWQWCFSQGVQNLNRSAGVGDGSPSGPQAQDMAQDFYVVHSPYPLITVSAGNCLRDPQNSQTVAPCFDSLVRGRTSVSNRSYNTLNVGASDDQATDSRDDDTLADFSQYTNPTTLHGDLELPNLLAPGVEGQEDLDSIRPMFSFAGHGTSASAPIVMGTALLMKQRDSTFAFWPEMVRATVMAASTRPVLGIHRTTSLGTSEDLAQGAGSLNAVRAVQLAAPSVYTAPNSAGVPNGRYGKTYDFASEFTSGISHDAYNITVNTSGRLRVVAAWDASPIDCDPTGNGANCGRIALDGDLDLWIEDSAGNSVCVSTTYDSSWELCDIAVTAGQTYKARLRLYSTSQPQTYLGIAWNNYSTASE